MEINKEEEVDEGETDTEEQTNGTGCNIQGRTHRWRKKYPPTCHTQVNENSISPVTDDVAPWTPLKYFKQFWDDEIYLKFSLSRQVYLQQLHSVPTL